MLAKIKNNNQGFNYFIIVGIAGGFLVLLVILAGIVAINNSIKAAKKKADNQPQPVATTAPAIVGAGTLPGDSSGQDGSGNNLTDIQAEKLTFADFYKKTDDKI